MGLGSWFWGGSPAGSAEAKEEMDRANQVSRDVTNISRQGALGAQGRQSQQLDANDPRYTAQDSSFRQNQAQMLALAQDRAMGRNTVAEQQYRQAANRGMAQQAAFAQAGRGNAAMAQRTAMNNQANINAALAGDASMAASQEANQYAALAGNMAGQARGQDIGLNQFNAQQQFGIGTQNQQAAQYQQQLNDQYQMGMLGRALEAGNQGFNNRMLYNQYLSSDQGFFGDLMGAGSTLGAAYLGNRKR